MRFIKENIASILLIIVAVLATILIRSLFSKTHKPEQMIRNEERIKYLEADRLKDSAVFHQQINWYDSLLAVEMSKDKELQIKYVPLKRVYDKIPVTVDNLDKQQLRSGTDNF